jgi:hypothetical protein
VQNLLAGAFGFIGTYLDDWAKGAKLLLILAVVVMLGAFLGLVISSAMSELFNVKGEFSDWVFLGCLIYCPVAVGSHLKFIREMVDILDKPRK